MVTLEPIDLDQLSVYFDGVRWELFPSVPVTKSFIFHRQDNETYEQFCHRVYAMCDAMNESMNLISQIMNVQLRVEKLEKAFSQALQECQKG